MFDGRPPIKPPGRVHVALVLLGFVAFCVITAVTWGAMPPLLTLAFFGLWLSVILGRLGNLASYHCWKGDRPGELLRLVSGLFSGGFLALLLAQLVLTGLQTGQWGWLWWAAFVNALTLVVLVAGRLYGADDGPPSGGASTEHETSE